MVPLAEVGRRKEASGHLRHGAALALLGWSLIVPPVYDYQGNIVIGIRRPISDWKIAKTYDSVQACQREMKHLVETGAPSTPQVFALPLNGLGADATPIGQVLVRHANCIASDDPRLKEH
jgi:hypothetical protein